MVALQDWAVYALFLLRYVVTRQSVLGTNQTPPELAGSVTVLLSAVISTRLFWQFSLKKEKKKPKNLSTTVIIATHLPCLCNYISVFQGCLKGAFVVPPK